MRFSSFVSCVAFLSAFPAEAAPFIAGEASAYGGELHASTSTAASSSDLTNDAVAIPSSSSTILPTHTSHDSQAHVAIPCQDCSGDGADVYPLFTFDLKQRVTGQCDVAFTINGTTVHLSDTSPSADFTVSSDPDLYQLYTDLSCQTSEEDRTVTTQALVYVHIQSFNGKPVSSRPGFAISAAPQAHIASVHLLQELKNGHRIVIPSIVSDATVEGPAEAEEPLDRAKAFVASVKQHLATVHASNNSEATESQHTDDACPIKHTVACIAQDVREGICGALESILTQLQSTIGESRTATYKAKVQKVMKSSTPHADCRKAKVSSEKTASAAHIEIVQEVAGPETPKKVKILESQTPLVIALEALISALGLAGLLAFLKRRCCSLRRRVERLADREERIKQREYRRAAREEAWRKRWAKVRRTCFCCFGSADCEEDSEKAALVFSAAAHGQVEEISDVEIMAQLEGLPYAHEIVAEIVRSRRNATAEATYASSRALGHATMVAHPYPHSHNNRSKTSSLPSYDSDVLPDYSSQPGSADLERGMRVADGMKRPMSRASTTGSSGCTPDSSIPEISPRVSAETLRTGLSRD